MQTWQADQYGQKIQQIWREFAERAKYIVLILSKAASRRVVLKKFGNIESVHNDK